MMETIGNSRGVRDVLVQDETTAVIDAHLSLKLGDMTILTQGAIDDLTIQVSSVVVPVIGDVAALVEAGGDAYFQAEIIAITPLGGDNYLFELDSPLDFPFGVNDIGSLNSHDLNVDGSITPVVFSLAPTGLAENVEWDITRMMASMIGSSAMDDGTFGSVPALLRGIVIREVNGQTKNVFNAKTNGEIKEHVFDLSYSDKAPAGQFGMGFRRSFNGQDKNGVVIRLSNVNGDKIQCIIQDDLTALNVFHLTAQGHQFDRGA